MATERQRAKQLDKNIAKGERSVKGILQRSQRSINGTIKEYTSKPNYITNARVRNRLYTELASQYKILNEDINSWIHKGASETSRSFWSYAKEDLPRGATAGTAVATFGSFSEKYLGDIIGFINPATVDNQVAMNAQIGGMMTSDIRALRAAVSTTMAEGAVEGLTNPEMAARMLQKVEKAAGTFTFIDKRGRRWSADNYFGMLNRTLHSTAARQSYIDTATNELGYDLYQIEGGVTGSSVEFPNDPCDNWAGRIISMTGNTKGYPTYQDAVSNGVFHPNCVHFVRALLPSEIPAAKKEEKQERKEARELPDE